MKFLSPPPSQIFTISSAPAWPGVVFETDGTGAHTWSWTVTWLGFKRSGQEATAGNRWDAGTAVTNLGGTLTVRAQAGAESANIAVTIAGTNPSPAEVSAYLATLADSAGFDKIIAHETRYQHFTSRNEPVRSFDSGYGMCQLTTPAPTFEQAWNWKANVDGGLKLFAQKRASAVAYLGQGGRSYTSDQVRYEAVCRWNGGSYHEWDAKAGKWVRRSNVLCDTKTGNIGWDMTDAANQGKSEAELHQRDSASYSRGPAAGAHWRYFGVCYADRILG